MTGDRLQKAQAAEIESWKKKSYSDMANIDFRGSLAYEGRVGDFVYQVEVILCEKNENFIQIMISVSNGVLSSFFPPSRSLVYHRDGRVDT